MNTESVEKSLVEITKSLEYGKCLETGETTNHMNIESVYNKQEKQQNLVNTESVLKKEKQQNPLNIESVQKQEKQQNLLKSHYFKGFCRFTVSRHF